MATEDCAADILFLYMHDFVRLLASLRHVDVLFFVKIFVFRIKILDNIKLRFGWRLAKHFVWRIKF